MEARLVGRSLNKDRHSIRLRNHAFPPYIRTYELTLDDNDIKYLNALENGGSVNCLTKEGFQFHLYPHLYEFSKAFSEIPPMPLGGYYAYVGGDCKSLEEFKDLIRKRGKMPMEIECDAFGKREKVTIGYVILKVK